ncbi:MAG: FAD-dependent oxidoreductase, partial [Ketobacter sp.]
MSNQSVARVESVVSKQKLVVIGNGMVGQKFLEQFTAKEQASGFDIITFCEESRVAYDRVQLSSYFSGKTADDLSLVEEGFFEKTGVQIRMGDKAVSIDRNNKEVTSANGEIISYDKLVLATGSYPFVPPIPGKDRPECLVYRTIE